MNREQFKPFLWGAVVAAIAVPSALLWAGWMVTAGTAHATAADMVESAVMKNLTPICVAQFSEDPTRNEQLTALKALDYWKREKFVANQGWATMPGSTSPDSDVASECAKQIAELEA